MLRPQHFRQMNNLITSVTLEDLFKQSGQHNFQRTAYVNAMLKQPETLSVAYNALVNHYQLKGRRPEYIYGVLIQHGYTAIDDVFSRTPFTLDWQTTPILDSTMQESIIRGYTQIVQSLLSREFIIRPDYLMLAAEYGRNEIIELLIQYGASVPSMVSYDPSGWMSYIIRTSRPPFTNQEYSNAIETSRTNGNLDTVELLERIRYI